MEAKDTVSPLNISRETQAEISFRAGMKEVVEFEDELLKGVPNYGWKGFLERRRAKLKEWGIDA